jgi:opacity protein-like surface antigen
MSRRLLAALCAACLTTPAWARAPEAPAALPDYSRISLGFGAGGTSGIGYAWRQTLSNGWGYALTGTVNIADRTPFGNLNGWSVGGQVLKIISAGERHRFYVLGGLHSFRWQVTDPVVNVGAGIGLELAAAKGVGLSLEVPLVFGYRFGARPGPAHFLPMANVLLMFNL